MLMVPGLALFYGGMVRRKNVLATMMQSMVALAVVGVYWIAIGYCLAFGQTQGGWIGWSPDKLLFQAECMGQTLRAIGQAGPRLIWGAGAGFSEGQRHDPRSANWWDETRHRTATGMVPVMDVAGFCTF